MASATRRTLLTGIAVIPIGMGISVFAYWSGEPRGDDLIRAKEMTHFIQQGQLNLRDATAIAEKHVKGMGLEVSCRLEAGSPNFMEKKGKTGDRDNIHESDAAGDQDKPQGKAPDKEKASEKRLIYEVNCFANDKLHTVRVDGLSKEVIDVKERSSFASNER